MSDRPPVSSFPAAEGRVCEVLEPLAGMEGGRLFRGRLVGAAGFSKVVAIKMVDEGNVERAELGQRLRDEARLLSLLRHRAIVGVDDLVNIGGRWAVLMEFVDGQDLGYLLASGPLPPRAACEIGVEIASALAHAHEATDPATGAVLGLVHRNVRPSNVRVTPKGEVKLVGFGFARARFAGREARTGYLAYDAAIWLAPECLIGQDSAASDVYALGASLAAALLGERPRALPPIAAAHAAGVAEIQRRITALIPSPAGAALASRIAAMLAYAPDARPAARAVEAELQDLAAELPGAWLRRWAPERVSPYSPPPPAPAVPAPADPRPRTARSPTPPPVAAARTSAPPPTPAPSARRQRLILAGVLAGAAVALLMGGLGLVALLFVLRS